MLPRAANSVQRFSDRVIHHPRYCRSQMDAQALRAMTESTRCPWATTELMAAYHDQEWGVPMHDDRALFELLTLEGAQAGLSWSTILRRRDGYRRAFENFDIKRVAEFDDADVTRLLNDSGIIRNRQKVQATIANAREVLRIQEENGSFDAYVWSFVDGKTIDHRFSQMSQIPATTPE